jgi:hypothetical protein
MQTLQANYSAKRVHSRGFSRVELLVCMVIAALALALLVPRINIAREAARRHQGKNNLRRLGFLMDGSSTRSNGELQYPAAMDPGHDTGGVSDVRLFAETAIAIFVTVGAMLAAGFIKFTIGFTNRRGSQPAPGLDGERPTNLWLDRWICPPSSSPL